MTCKNQKSNTHHQVHRQTRSERSPAAVIRARQKARGASRGGPREPQAWVEGSKTMASPGYCGKETFIATCFLKCLRLETHILSHLPCTTLVALLRVLPAPTSSTGSSEAGVAGGQLLLGGLFRVVRSTTEDTCRQNNSAFMERAPSKMEAIRSMSLFKATGPHVLTQTQPQPYYNQERKSFNNKIFCLDAHTHLVSSQLLCPCGIQQLKGSCML